MVEERLDDKNLSKEEKIKKLQSLKEKHRQEVLEKIKTYHDAYNQTWLNHRKNGGR